MTLKVNIIIIGILTLLLSFVIAFSNKINTITNEAFSEKIYFSNQKFTTSEKYDLYLIFDFYAPSGNIELQNLFQTANLNEGIRAEFSKTRELYLLANTKSNELVSIKLAKRILPNAKYTLEVAYKNDRVVVKLNNQIIPNTLSNFKISFANPLMNQGFDTERIFQGRIENVKGYFLQKQSLNFSAYIKIMLIVLIGFFVYLIFKKQDGESQDLISKFNCITNHSKHNDLLLLRVLAWIFVFIIHSYIVFQVDVQKFNLLLRGIDFSFVAFPSAWAGVWIFFVLSGYLMGKGFISNRYELNKTGITNFYTNRAIQIIPIYYFSIITIAIFVHPEIFHSENIQYLLELLFFTNDSELPININGALWSISTEVQFYLIVPLIMYLLLTFKIERDGKKIFILFILTIVYGVAVRGLIYYSNHQDFAIWGKMIYKPFFVNLDLFLFGILANFMVDKAYRGNFRIITNKIFIIISVLILIFGNSYIGYKTFVLSKFGYFFVSLAPTITALLTVFLIISFELRSHPEGANHKQKLRKIFYFLGILTFPVYIWHEPILFQITKITGSDHYGLNVLISLILILCVAIMSYVWIEKPMNKQKRKRS